MDTNHITEAEWQIMRVLWSKSPVTSNYIIETLGEKMGWSPTTIKTLLGRLVKKNAINFEPKKSTYYYYPLVTEKDCMKIEIQSLVKRVYGGVLNKETDHFKFFGDHVDHYIASLAKALEDNYERIVTDLRYPLTEKVVVYIHSNLQSFHSAIGLMNGPDWLRVSWIWEILHIVPNEYFNDLPADKAAVQALAGIITYKINPFAPNWLQQGIVAYEAKFSDKTRIKELITEKFSKNEISTVSLLASNYNSFLDNNEYVHSCAYTVVQFIVEKYGYEKLLLLLRSPYDFAGIFSCTEEEFSAMWFNFLKENYIEQR